MTKEKLLSLRDKFLADQREWHRIEAELSDLKEALIEYFFNEYFYQRSRTDPKWSYSVRQKIKVSHDKDIPNGWFSFSGHSLTQEIVEFTASSLKVMVYDNLNTVDKWQVIEISLEELFEPIETLTERHTKEYLSHLAKVEQVRLEQVRKDELAELKRLKEKYPNE